MKKVFSILMTLFFMSSFSFANSGMNFITGCEDYAENAANAAEEFYGVDHTLKTWNADRKFFLSECNEAGGANNISDPVFM